MRDLLWPTDNAPCCYGDGGCVCTGMEQALRAWAGGAPMMPAMNVEQREICLVEIGRVEGYALGDYEGLTDHDIAAGVLEAWTDYCRDKGLL